MSAKIKEKFVKLIYTTTTTTSPIQYILPKHINNFGFRKQQIAMTQQFLSWRSYSTGNCEGFCEIIFVPMRKKNEKLVKLHGT